MDLSDPPPYDDTDEFGDTEFEGMASPSARAASTELATDAAEYNLDPEDTWVNVAELERRLDPVTQALSRVQDNEEAFLNYFSEILEWRTNVNEQLNQIPHIVYGRCEALCAGLHQHAEQQFVKLLSAHPGSGFPPSADEPAIDHEVRHHLVNLQTAMGLLQTGAESSSRELDQRLQLMQSSIDSVCHPLQQIFDGYDTATWKSAMPSIFEWQCHPLRHMDFPKFSDDIIREVERWAHNLF